MLPAPRVGCAGVGEGLLGEHVGEGVHLAVVGVDAAQGLLDQVDGGQLTGADGVGHRPGVGRQGHAVSGRWWRIASASSSSASACASRFSPSTSMLRQST